MAAKKSTSKTKVAEKKTVSANDAPRWAAFSLTGGIVAFIAFFTEIFGDTRSVIVDGEVFDVHVSLNGIEMIANQYLGYGFSVYKVFPAIIAGLALCVVLYSIYGMVVSSGEKPARFPFMILGFTSLVMIVFELIFIFMAFGRNIIDDPLALVDVSGFHPGVGIWMMVFGTVLIIAGGMAHLFKSR